MELKELSKYIPIRKSIRNYIQSSVDPRVLDDLADFLKVLSEPVDIVTWGFGIVSAQELGTMAGREPGIKAPYYLLLRAEGEKFTRQSAGYMGELACLWLCSRGLGSCWQGGITLDNDHPDTLPYIAAVAFGATDEPMRQDSSEFVRKNLSRIIRGSYNENYKIIAEAVRLCPSSLNRQPVRLSFDGDRIHIFRRNVFFNNPSVTHTQRIDAGAALAHMEVTARSLGLDIYFAKTEPQPRWSNKIYQATAFITPESID